MKRTNALRAALVVFLVLLLLAGCSQPKSRIAGKLRGADGKPMALAHVHLIDAAMHGLLLPVQENDLLCTQADSNGEFELTTDLQGAYVLVLTGVGHHSLEIPLLLTTGTSIGLQAQLGVLGLDSSAQEIQITYNTDIVRNGEHILLKKNNEGLYERRISSTRDRLRYYVQLIPDLPNQLASILGTTSNGYELDSDRRYATVVTTTDGLAQIRIDPSIASRLAAAAHWQFDDPKSTQARFAAMLSRFNRWTAQFEADRGAHILAGNSVASFHGDWNIQLDTLLNELRTERDQSIRDEAVVEMLEIAVLAPNVVAPERLNSYLDEVSPTSPVWEYHNGRIFLAEKFHARTDAYTRSAIEQSSCKEFRAYLLFDEAQEAFLRRDTTTLEQLTDRLMSEFSETRAGRSPIPSLRLRLTEGAQLPGFSLVSLDDSAVVYKSQTFSGKYLFVDFWNTDCPACIGQMKELHSIYEKYHPKGLEYLSVSNDPSPKYVRHFRATKWKMPWPNTVLSIDQSANIMHAFDVGAVPKNILVSPSGKILLVSNGPADSLESRILRSMQRED